MVAKPLCPLYKNIIKPLDRARYPELRSYLNSNVKYPDVAQENGVQGRVIVESIIEKDGSMSDVKVIRSVDPSLDREALRVVKAMPKWTPAKLKGIPVRTKCTTPVVFRLQ